MPQPLLSIQNLTIAMPHSGIYRPLVDNISFELNRGKIFALVGESGSGKSMTSLAIMQLLPLNARFMHHSRILFNGEDLIDFSEMKMHAIRGKRIAMIFQEPMTSLNPVLTVGEQIKETVQLHQKLTRKNAKLYAKNLLKEVGLKETDLIYDKYPHQLSGGMKQRIMIAIALAGEPDILIADEPTTALDVTIQAQILQLLKNLQQKKGMGILLITHDLGIVAEIADDIGVMYAGRLIEHNEVKAFFRAPMHPYSQQLLASLPKFTHRSPTIPSTNIPILTVANLEISFPIRKGLFRRKVSAIKAVDNVSFILEKGKTLAVVGESGCGKTTLAKAIVGLTALDAGTIAINGILSRPKKFQQRIVQIVFQDPFSSMNPRMLVADILAEGVIALGIMRKKTSIKAYLTDLLEQVHLPADSLDRYPHEFSGGQRQRICIARALAVKPKLLVCDELTSALDVLVQAQILQLLKNLKNTKQLSYLFITHNIGVVAEIADNVIVMHKGKVIETGDVGEVLFNPQHSYTKKLISSVPKPPVVNNVLSSMNLTHI